MSRDLQILQQPLDVASEPGLPSTDGRLTLITDLAERRSFREAADRVEELLADGIYDIRAISVYLFQAFFEGGFAVAGEVLSTLQGLLTTNLEAVGPQKRREDHFNRRMSWLFDTIIDTTRYHALKQTPEWKRWTDAVDLEAVEVAVAAGDALMSALGSPNFKLASQSLSRLIEVLRGQAEQLKAPVPATKAAEPAVSTHTPQVQAAGDEGGSLEPVRRRVELVVTHPFLELSAKLKAFEQLIEQGDIEKAALVGDDINTTLESFDPRSYFPELFGAYSALMSKHILRLSGYWENRDSPSWKALTQFYRVDLRGFVSK
jgi:hypothetical protein